MGFWSVLSCILPTRSKTIFPIDIRPTSTIHVRKQPIQALFDTGSSVTLIHSKFKSQLIKPTDKGLYSGIPKLCGADGRPLTIQGCYELPFHLAKNKPIFTTRVLFIDHLQTDCIIGMDLMTAANISLHADTKTISINAIRPQHSDSIFLKPIRKTVLGAQSEVSLPMISNQPFEEGLIEAKVMDDIGDIMIMDGITSTQKIDSQNVCVLVVSNFGGTDVTLDTSFSVPVYTNCKMKVRPIEEVFSVQEGIPKLSKPPDVSHMNKIDLENIPVSYRSQYRSLLHSYADVFSRDDLDVGHCKTLPHRVRLLDPDRVTSINQYRLPHHLKEVAMDYVKRLLAAGVVRKSSSIFNSPLMLVKKPHADPKKPLAEQYRLVHNYIELNKNIAPCSYPLRNLYELLDEVATGTVFSVLDLSQGFFQQSLEDPNEVTSFSIPGMGQFTYNRSPQGLNSSPAYFQRLLDFVLNGIDRVYVYIDDVVVSVRSHSEMLLALEKVFSRFRQHNLKVKPSKCNIGAGTITYLGYEICSKKGVSPGLAKTEVIKNWPVPQTVKDIRAFIGLTSFFRRAIKDYSLLSAPLNKLIRKDSGFKPNSTLPDDALNSFKALQTALCSKPCLQPVDFERRFYVTCDASATHYGSCLSQIGTDGIERPCGYSSKLLNPREASQTPGIRERNSLLHALRHWQPYLVGKEFTLRTDHKPNLAIANGRTKLYDSLSDEILNYLPFKLEYLSGKNMFVDALSRPPNAVSLAKPRTHVGLPGESVCLCCVVVDKTSISKTDIQTAQAKDKTLLPLITACKAKQASVPGYSLSSSGLLLTASGQIVVPAALTRDMLFMAHDTAGHFSKSYTLANLEQFHWSGKTKDVDNYCSSCVTCSQVNVARPKTRLALRSMRPEAVWFNDRVHLDIVDMPKSCEGHVAIVTITDAATGFVILQAVKDKTGESVVTTLYNKLFPFFGVPRILVTDKGKENMNEEMKLLCSRFNIQQVFTSTNHPQANGMVERRQQMITQFFRKATGSYDDQANWFRHLSTLQLVLNSSKSASRLYSPFFLTFFRQANFPFQQLLLPTKNYNENSTVAARVDLAHKTVSLAYKSFQDSFAKSKYQFDKLERSKAFREGSIVYVWTTQRPARIHHKFAKRYRGPYICLNAERDVLDLRPLSGGKMIQVHKNNCKLGSLREQLFDFSDTTPSGAPENEENVQIHRPTFFQLQPLDLLDEAAPVPDPPGVEPDQPDAPDPPNDAPDPANDQQLPANPGVLDHPLADLPDPVHYEEDQDQEAGSNEDVEEEESYGTPSEDDVAETTPEPPAAQGGAKPKRKYNKRIWDGNPMPTRARPGAQQEEQRPEREAKRKAKDRLRTVDDSSPTESDEDPLPGILDSAIKKTKKMLKRK